MGKVSKAKALKQKIARRVEASKREVTALKTNVQFKAKAKSTDRIPLLRSESSTPVKKFANKKEKFIVKHKNLIRKVVLHKKMRKEEIARKNREKAGVVGDMRKLKDALPSLDELYKLSKENIKTGIEAKPQEKLKTKEKIKKRKDLFMNRVDSLRALLKDRDFKKNPRELIDYHIKYTNGLVE